MCNPKEGCRGLPAIMQSLWCATGCGRILGHWGKGRMLVKWVSVWAT